MNDLESFARRAAETCHAFDWPGVIEEIEAAGLSMAGLARACGSSEPAIAAIRHGRTQEPRDLLARRILAARECLLTVPHETYFFTVSDRE
jgi:transcriptional regulator with XRE-family HTH domain